MRRAGGILRSALAASRANQHFLQKSVAVGCVGTSQLRFLQSSDGPKGPAAPQVPERELLHCVYLHLMYASMKPARKQRAETRNCSCTAEVDSLLNVSWVTCTLQCLHKVVRVRLAIKVAVVCIVSQVDIAPLVGTAPG